MGAIAALFIYREVIENKRPHSEVSHDDLKRLDALEDLRKRLSGGNNISRVLSNEEYGGVQLSSGKLSPVNKGAPREWVHSSWGSQKTFNNKLYDRIPDSPAADESI